MISAVKRKTDRGTDAVIALALVAGLVGALVFYGLPLIYSIGKLFQ
jgi:hypothetical protein